jgi:hypothetical protein
MSDGFTIGAATQAPTIFQCPKCNEAIDSTAESCRFCGATVDHEAAEKAAELLARVNQACSDASYMRSTALALPVFFLVRFVPFIAMAGTVGFIGVSIVVPVWAVRWWLKYGKVASTDAEFRKARGTVRWAGTLIFAIFLVLVVFPLVLAILARAVLHS